MHGLQRLLAGIHEFMRQPSGQAGKNHAFESPVGHIDERFVRGRPVGQHVPKEKLRHQVGFDLTEGAGEEPVGLFQRNRRPALRALMFDNKFDDGYPLRSNNERPTVNSQY